MSDPKLEAWIARIDKVRGVIALSVYALLSDCGPEDSDSADALDLANEELQRLRDEIDVANATTHRGTS